ncbi:unnamed protein product [Moneuplotes crassus]|uniref:Uncharacterized protein n=1 Tax=Euplotes crassus TaxID=5936 RepID=A0AAD1Y818_EUPCR|nr:unnamed protein product [Moneuplotes crassus]
MYYRSYQDSSGEVKRNSMITYHLEDPYREFEDQSYRNPCLIVHEKGNAGSSEEHYGTDHTKIIEFDTTIQREIARDQLFMLREVHISPVDNCTCSIKAFAVFVHDYPVVAENHPLTIIVKVLYDSLGWNGERPIEYIREESIEEKTQESNIHPKEEFLYKRGILKGTPAEDIYNVYNNVSNDRIIPRISEINDNSLEFSQKFYNEKFSLNISEEFKMDVDRIISKLPKSSEYLPVMESLDMTQVIEDFNYRLAAIAFNLDTGTQEFKIMMPPNTYGRYITILGLDTHRLYEEHSNYDIGQLIFSGFQIPSCLTLEK